jgi:hypothetical protein
MPVKGSAEYTDHLSVAVSPEMKQKVEAAGRLHGVRPAVIARWALEQWLTINLPADDEDATGAVE